MLPTLKVEVVTICYLTRRWIFVCVKLCELIVFYASNSLSREAETALTVVASGEEKKPSLKLGNSHEVVLRWILILEN